MLNNFINRVWSGYHYYLYPSTTSCEKFIGIHSQTIHKEYQSIDDMYKSSSYDLHGPTNTCIIFPFECTQSSTLINEKKMIANVDPVHAMKSKNGLEFEGNKDGYDQCSIDLSGTVANRRRTKKSYSMNASISESIFDKSAKGRRRVLKCHYCPYITNHKGTLRKHIYAVHYEPTNVVCPKCGITSKHKYSLNVHLNYCGKEPRFCCTYCPYKAWKRHHLQRHSRKHVEKNVKEVLIMPKAPASFPMPMPTCNRNTDALPISQKAEQQTVEKQQLQFNENYVMPTFSFLLPLPMPLYNPYSNYYSPSYQKTEQKAIMQEQLQLNVDGYVPIVPKASALFQMPIPTCDQNSAPPQNQKIEQKTVKKQTQFSVKECPACGKAFRYWGHLQEHYKSCSQNYIQCKYSCPYKTKDSTMLKIHVLSVHPNISSEEALVQNTQRN